MPEITYLTSKSKKHLSNHFELRGLGTPVRDGGSSWWLVFDRTDSPPELIGSEDQLPIYAREQLRALRVEPKARASRKARYIPADMIFSPGEAHDGIPHEESVEWLRQYVRQPPSGRYSDYKSYLVVLDSENEDYPLQIWEHRPTKWCPQPGLLESSYTLVWTRTKGDTQTSK